MKKANITSMILLFCFGGLMQCTAEPVSERLIGWWRLDDETNATVFVDSSGHGRDATFGSGVSIVENGRFGRAAHFNGTGDSWARFTNPELTNMTISAWVFMEAYNNILPRIMQMGPLYYHMPQSQPGQFTLGMNSQNNWTTATSVPFKFETGEWFHAAVVYQQRYTNATDRVVWPIFYINGVRCNNPMPEKIFTQTIPAGSGYLGNTGLNGTRPLQGFMDDVRLYNVALSDRDILAIYHNTPAAS